MWVVQKAQMAAFMCSGMHYRGRTMSPENSQVLVNNRQAWYLSQRKTLPHPSGLPSENDLGNEWSFLEFLALSDKNTQGHSRPMEGCYSKHHEYLGSILPEFTNFNKRKWPDRQARGKALRRGVCQWPVPCLYSQHLCSLLGPSVWVSLLHNSHHIFCLQ